jgi:hypothetical protein
MGGYTKKKKKKKDKEQREKTGVIHKNYHPFYLHDASVFPANFW